MTKADAAMAFALDYLVEQACLGWATNVLLAVARHNADHELLAVAYSFVASTLSNEAKSLRRGG